MPDSRSHVRLLIAGTGTGVGKTHVACALLRRLRARGWPIVGLKPIETGLDVAAISDQHRLSLATMGMLPADDSPSGFHVKHPTAKPQSDAGAFHVKPSPYWFGPPVSPHLAARDAGQRIDLGAVRDWVLEAEQSSGGHAAMVETAGGLFTPLGPGMTNLDLVLAMEPAVLLLVGPDRLGVMHEVTATFGLAGARGRPIDTVVLSEPNTPDSSTGHNAREFDRLGIACISAVFPWASEDSAATEQQANRLSDWIDREIRRRVGQLPV
jgi:dethiobiotin synthetase